MMLSENMYVYVQGLVAFGNLGHSSIDVYF